MDDLLSYLSEQGISHDEKDGRIWVKVNSALTAEQESHLLTKFNFDYSARTGSVVSKKGVLL